MPLAYKPLAETRTTRIISEADLLARLGISHGSLRAMLRDAEDPLPGPVTITPRRKGYVEAEINAWVERRMQRRDDGLRRAADTAARRPTFARSAQ